MSDSRLTIMIDSDKGQVPINWTQVLDDAIKYDTNNEEEMMRAKAKERKSCTHCAWAQVVCEFLMDSNKKWVACVWCNQSKGKCQWPRDRKDAKAGLKVTGKVNKGKKWKVNKENTEAGPSKQKWAKTSVRLVEILDLNEPKAGRSGLKEASVARYSALESKLKQLIEATGLIANNLASLFKLHETAVENLGLGQITNTLESKLDKSYGFRVAVTPSDLGSSKLNSDELHEEAEWLQAEGEEEEAEGEDENMAKAE
ncbi:hypothetical protein M404DRAFT_17858 [Pisolithus tinctorius Marx 270]|uniref:Zn(2)-C6 fungal-type domain-containing protein n=1 Tax=Pisolithus tinctorius Marx 270 TaxID=870435 RepID=A0A0C3K0S9_PISTI|nr:hypothetical protein M404DRAFT_17858 [Pisolithus tinctorius Marx 270]